eukprot:655866-Prymnesium_polylepis.1
MRVETASPSMVDALLAASCDACRGFGLVGRSRTEPCCAMHHARDSVPISQIDEDDEETADVDESDKDAWDPSDLQSVVSTLQE